MSGKPKQSVRRRAASYASGKRNAGTHSGSEEGALAEGWEDGYKAAIRDVKQVGADLSMDVGRELEQALSDVVERAAKTYKEALEDL